MQVIYYTQFETLEIPQISSKIIAFQQNIAHKSEITGRNDISLPINLVDTFLNL